jgi:hypothetical protein
VLKVLAAPGMPQQIYVETTWDDPGAWGLLLADVARHAARVYAQQGMPEAEALSRITQFFQSELTSPTDRSDTP